MGRSQLRNMAEIISLAGWRKAFRDKIAAEIVQADRNPETDHEADKLLDSLSQALARAPLAEEEKLLALLTKLVEGLALIESERERKRYADEIAKHLRLDVVEAAIQAFRQFR